MNIKSTYILTIILLITCKNQNSLDTNSHSLSSKIEGRITGFYSSIELRSINKSFTIQLDSTGYFSKKISREQLGEYTLYLGMNNRIPLYIGAETNLNIKINFDRLKNQQPNSIHYSGTHIEETKLLHVLFLREPINQYTVEQYRNEYIPMVYSKNPSEFETYQLEQLENIKLQIANYRKSHELNPDFLEKLELNNVLKFDKKFKLYQGTHNYLTSRKINITGKLFQNYFSKEIPENDMGIYETNMAYRNYLIEKYHNIMAKMLGQKGEYLDYFKAKASIINSSDFPEKIKQDLYKGFVIDYMNIENKDIRNYIEIIISEYVKDSISIDRFKKFKKQELTYVNGDSAPNFTYPNIKGESISLSDFKGNLVYIDLWATWCAPCLQELPDLKMLKEKYEGQEIVFLGISFDENVNVWKKMVTKNEHDLFNDIQLFTGTMENNISKDYNVNGIPHYILIDHDGKIIQKNALRPSDPKLIEVIDGLLEYRRS